MPKGIPLTEEELTRRRREIFDVAMHLFVEKGFNETSMREIGEAAGVGKSTLYDYFPSKDEIMISFVVEEVRQMTAWAEEIIAQELSAAEKLRRILRKHLQYMAANKLLFLRLTYETQRLSFESLQRIQMHRHAYQDMLCDLVREGIRNGEVRPVNPLIAIRGIFSLLTSAVYTSRPTGSAEEMLMEAFDIIFKGLEVR
ncbi:MAG: TetR/AcrR family transcriptional regulator [Anaerolineales bacterium]|nr:TetR/AcrR family transcriptional regulator [Anaerolineales bacterium]